LRLRSKDKPQKHAQGKRHKAQQDDEEGRFAAPSRVAGDRANPDGQHAKEEEDDQTREELWEKLFHISLIPSLGANIVGVKAKFATAGRELACVINHTLRLFEAVL